jgi:enoyl-CoA hydratase
MSTPSPVSNELLIDRLDGGILVLTFNRPEAKNAMTLALSKAMVAALDELDSDPELKLAVVTGAGGTFCSGMDLKGFLRGERPAVEGRGFGGLTVQSPRKPLIAAVEGYALAGGFEAMLACDLIVAARSAQFGVPEVKRGLVASAGGLMRLPGRIPYHIAMQYALTGEFMSAARAYELGLVNQLVEPGQALDGALKLARSVTANGPMAVQVTKQIVQQSRDWTEAEMWDKQQPIAAPVFESEDAKEGSRAFAEKRAPVWTGR